MDCFFSNPYTCFLNLVSDIIIVDSFLFRGGFYTFDRDVDGMFASAKSPSKSIIVDGSSCAEGLKDTNACKTAEMWMQVADNPLQVLVVLSNYRLTHQIVRTHLSTSL